MSPSTMGQASPPVPATGNGETLTFSMPGGVNSKSTQYYGIVATIPPNAASRHTIGIDGSDNALDINFSDGTRPLNKINSQTNVADLQTIGVSGITYTTEPSPAGNVAPGAVEHPFYTFKVALMATQHFGQRRANENFPDRNRLLKSSGDLIFVVLVFGNEDQSLDFVN